MRLLLSMCRRGWVEFERHFMQDVSRQSGGWENISEEDFFDRVLRKFRTLQFLSRLDLSELVLSANFYREGAEGIGRRRKRLDRNRRLCSKSK